MHQVKGVVGITVDPWIADDRGAFRELQLGDLAFHTLILQCNPFYQQYLLCISGSMDIRTKSDVALNPSPAEVDNSFVEFVLDINGSASTLDAV